MNKKLLHSRREFLNLGMGLGGTVALHPLMSACSPLPNASPTDTLELHIFSKHLQFLDYEGMAETAAEIGFDGIDLTVRPKGHVAPERAADDLPKAVAAIKKAGLKAELMASDVNQVDDAVNRTVLDTASAQGIRFYRLKYLSFSENKPIPEDLAGMNRRLKDLAAYNAEKGLAGTYQNHAGKKYVGAAIWDIWHLLQGIDPAHLGAQYDIRHAVVEGAMSWENGLRLIRPHINTLVLKDFIWEKQNGQWKLKNVPFGEGMVDFPYYFKLLKQYPINVPVSMHFEYDLAGAEHGDRDLNKADQALVIAAMKRDVALARKTWEDA